MKQTETGHPAIDRAQIQALSDLNPVWSMFILSGEWAIIAGAIALHVYFPYPIVYLVVWILIGSRMYALYSLLHDGIHLLLLPDRRINDRVCRLLLAWPLFINLTAMRRAHLAHHRHLQTPEDPELAHLRYSEFQFPRPALALMLTLLLDISGINFIRYKAEHLIRLLSPASGRQTDQAYKYSLPQLLYYVIVAAIILYMDWGIPFLLYWILPYITIYQALNRLRLSTEHFHLGEDTTYQTRSVKLNRMERFFLSPHNLGFHTEHHIYPSVPFYRLPALHRTLMADEGYRKEVIVNSSYAEVIKKYTN